MSKKETTQENVFRTIHDMKSNTTDDRRSTHEGSYGVGLPGFMKPGRDKPVQNPNQDQEGTTPQTTAPETPVASDNPNPNTNQEGSTENN